jgi:sodium/bile acid cotransporter 7
MTLIRSAWSRIDRFLAVILLTVAFAAVMPARGDAAAAVGWLADAAIVLLFFMLGRSFRPKRRLLERATGDYT